MLDIGLLLGLMCKYACEQCDMILFGDDKTKSGRQRAESRESTSRSNYGEVELEKGTILDNMARLVELSQLVSRGRTSPLVALVAGVTSL